MKLTSLLLIKLFKGGTNEAKISFNISGSWWHNLSRLWTTCRPGWAANRRTNRETRSNFRFNGKYIFDKTLTLEMYNVVANYQEFKAAGLQRF